MNRKIRVLRTCFGPKGVRIRVLDIAAFLFAIGVSIAFSRGSFQSDGGARSVVMKTPNGEWIYPVAEAREFPAYEGPGICRISIRDSEARVVSSDCPNRICIAMGAISQPRQWIACVPHQVFLRIEGSDPDGPDAVSL